MQKNCLISFFKDAKFSITFNILNSYFLSHKKIILKNEIFFDFFIIFISYTTFSI